MSSSLLVVLFCRVKTKREQDEILADGWSLNRNAAPLCHGRFRVWRHKSSLMPIDFLLTLIRLSVGAGQLPSVGCGPTLTAVISADRGWREWLWMTAIITPFPPPIIGTTARTTKLLTKKNNNAKLATIIEIIISPIRIDCLICFLVFSWR